MVANFAPGPDIVYVVVPAVSCLVGGLFLGLLFVVRFATRSLDEGPFARYSTSAATTLATINSSAKITRPPPTLANCHPGRTTRHPARVDHVNLDGLATAPDTLQERSSSSSGSSSASDAVQKRLDDGLSQVRNIIFPRIQARSSTAIVHGMERADSSDSDVSAAVTLTETDAFWDDEVRWDELPEKDVVTLAARKVNFGPATSERSWMTRSHASRLGAQY